MNIPSVNAFKTQHPKELLWSKYQPLRRDYVETKDRLPERCRTAFAHSRQPSEMHPLRWRLLYGRNGARDIGPAENIGQTRSIGAHVVAIVGDKSNALGTPADQLARITNHIGNDDGIEQCVGLEIKNLQSVVSRPLTVISPHLRLCLPEKIGEAKGGVRHHQPRCLEVAHLRQRRRLRDFAAIAINQPGDSIEMRPQA